MATVLISPCIKACFSRKLSKSSPQKLAQLSSLFLHHQKSLLLATAICAPNHHDFSSIAATQPITPEEAERLLSELTVKVRSSDEAVLDSYTQFVQRAAKVLNLDISGKIVLPRHIEKRTLLKSPHIYKKHRAQYELRTHARMFQVRQMTGETSDIFLEYIQRNLPEGVSMSVEQTELEFLPQYLHAPTTEITDMKENHQLL